MEPNLTPPIPPFQQPVQPPPQIPVTSDKTSNKSFNSIIIISIVLVIVIIGGGVYAWQDFQAGISKRSDETKRRSLEQQLENVETSPIVDQVVHEPTSRANLAKALSNAQLVLSAAEFFNAETGHYPALTIYFLVDSNSVKLPAEIVVSTVNPTADNGTTTFRWEYTGDASAPTGGRITFWDFSNDRVSPIYIYVGAANSSSTFITPAY